MILQSLTEQQMKRSQFNYLGYSLANGIGYCCVSDMVMLLLINRLGFPDWVFTTLSALFSIGYIWLPLGKISTAKCGAARTQSNFWFIRNVAAVIMSACTIWGIYGFKVTAGCFLLGGAFIFYGCRAAGCVMSTSLIGNITKPEDRGKLLATASMFHNFTTSILILGLTFLLKYSQSLWTLYGLILFGASCGIVSALFLRRIDESDAIQKAAQEPMLKESLACLKDSGITRMIIARICISIAMATTTGISMLILKRGYQVSDSMALFFSLMGNVSGIISARLAARVGDIYGPRTGVIIGCCNFFLVIAFWLFAPETFNIAIVLPFFLISNFINMANGICQGQYFLKCVPVERQPAASIICSVCESVLAGFLSMFICGLLWKGCDHIVGVDVAGLARYRCFLKLALPIVCICFTGVFVQKKV